jgi:penicillin-binding protein 1C
VDLLAVGRAAWHNLLSGRVVSGASTITMLVGKLTEPRPRTLWTKIVESRHAWYLEKRLSKDELLEQYLNRAPFGANIAGIEAAARGYFAKSAADLTLSEAALLIGLPQSPSRLRPDLHPDRACKRRNYILEKMKLCGFITEQQFKQASDREISLARQPAAFLAPHFCDLVARLYPHPPSLVTSLDLDLQALAEKVLRSRLDELRDFKVHGGAIVVLDVKTGGVRAMVGSPDYTSRADNGQVNAAIARRSPGSALKPFVYAMALDEGMCSPQTIVADLPVNFAGYRPKNYNRDYCGPVSVKDALVQSLNIPVLLYVRKIGLKNVVCRLRAAGISTLDRAADHYGLSVAIGTCEVRLLDLVNAYACLARMGLYRDATCLERAGPDREIRLFSNEAAYLIAEMLSGDERAFDAGGHLADVRLPRVAWKTGTSAGNRDAWCLAYNPDYVVGVWIGNPSGRASPSLIGGSAAAPAALGIFRNLYPNGDAPWYQRPKRLGSRQVCKASGQIPNPYCPITIVDDYIPGITDCSECAVHQPAIAEADLLDGKLVREVWPPEVAAFLASCGLATKKQTDDDMADKRTGPSGDLVRITSPGRTETFRFVDDTPAFSQEIALRAVTGSTSSGLYWFVDRQLYCMADPASAVSWPLQRGTHIVGCVDGEGRGDSVTVIVE